MYVSVPVCELVCVYKSMCDSVCLRENVLDRVCECVWESVCVCVKEGKREREFVRAADFGEHTHVHTHTHMHTHTQTHMHTHTNTHTHTLEDISQSFVAQVLLLAILAKSRSEQVEL